MEFLRPLYEDELNEEGDVEIVGLPFQRSRILTELEPDAFNATFEDWLVQRKLNCLEKASEILDLFDNRNRFEQLQRTFDNDKVMPFLGGEYDEACRYQVCFGG